MGSGGKKSDLGELVRRTAVEPGRLPELLAAWNAEFDPEKGLEGPGSLAAAADSALRAIGNSRESDAVGHQIARLINVFPHSVVVTNAEGVVSGLNTTGMARLDLTVGDRIDDLQYQLEAAENISDAIRRMNRQKPPGEIVLKRAVHSETDRPATIALVQAPTRTDGTRFALLFVIDPERQRETEAMLARAYGLTTSENEVVCAFLDGGSLKSIARRRGRSEATVRTQFQVALSKTGARSQAELMRNALALSQFASQLSDLAGVARHPHRKTAQILRPGGRTLDVVLAGDMSGAPVVFLSTLTHHTSPPRVEAELQGAGLLAVHLWRPGFGRTDPPPSNAAYAETLAGDLAAVLTQLGVDRCPLVALNAATLDAVDLGARCPERISRILVLGPVLPRPYQRRETLGTPWGEAIYRTMGSNPALLRVMVRTGLRAWKVLGTRRFAAMQLAGSAADLGVLDEPEVLAELDRAMIDSNAQGVDANVREAQRIISDWSEVADACRVPIDVIHGTEDPCTDVAISRAFAAADPDRTRLVEIAGAGFYSLFSHTDAVVRRLAAATRD
jgi:pimeloyl-ACP methyl ester carboxylesterase